MVVLQLVRAAFVDPRAPNWQRRVLTAGIQRLLAASDAHCDAFREAAVELIVTNRRPSFDFHDAFAVWSASLYRIRERDGVLASGDDARALEIFLSEYQKLLNM